MGALRVKGSLLSYYNSYFVLISRKTSFAFWIFPCAACSREVSNLYSNSDSDNGVYGL